ncbi:MAG: transglycosylase SLT domain-containing protein [Xanthomonadales bacterium]|nr:transglycosylase SLT domain-containing protein [Gammaproteobacteria bacterium]MBT8052849.1 transglycosylase SLT domain-containing protein [Gammaproteobacteria bacterium]NNK50001.1 transglycosylase SLT domain-containing protein [Xanthomonadales bacterium]
MISNRLKNRLGLFEFTLHRVIQTGLIFVIASAAAWPAAANTKLSQREAFAEAWQAAARGKTAEFERLMPGLENYLLFPYLQYEDLRFRRADVPVEDMAAFLHSHRDWAFSAGLKTAWLRTLGKRRNWDALVRYAPGSKNTEVRCHLARARINLGQTTDLLPEVRSLWAVGESQPKACDPAFSWLRKQGGITPGLAWERIRRAMDARQPKLVVYLTRYLGPEDQVWADRWYQQDRGGYRRLDSARKWPDSDQGRDITAYGLRRLARSDPDRAWKIYRAIEGGFGWPAGVRAGITRELALWSAVEGADATPDRMRNVPTGDRDGTLLEWWVRFDLSRGNWKNVIGTIEQMPQELRQDARWRYWEARARLEIQDLDRAGRILSELAAEASYFGFLSADQLGQPYTICLQEPEVLAPEVEALRSVPEIERALELRAAGLPAWARREWKRGVKGFDKAGLRTAAALATAENWPDVAILALGDSGDRRWYDWRFPLAYTALVEALAGQQNLDPAWVFGLMRSESAMAEDAVSSAGARGLMQVMPATARQVSRRHSLSYTGQQQLMRAEDNIRFGTTYLRELMDRFDDNPVLASGAYNAGPNAVERWLNSRQVSDPAIWIETLPYFETRDYIPRVLAFSTLYDWRLEKPVSRISSRMPAFNSGAVGGTMQGSTTAEVVCRTSG